MKINIYLTTEDRKKLEQIKWKYHVSYSTIANIVTIALSQKLDKKYFSEYIYKDKGTKTSIKNRYTWEDLANTSKVYTNCLKIYLNKEITKYSNETINKEVTNKIANELNNTYEENWNGNYFNRLMPKLIKKNRSYYKKILEVE